jgi:hypothetical protein
MGDEDRRRSLLEHAKPKEMGSGIWSWWFDDDSAALGEQMVPSLLSNPASYEDCLAACNDNSACAAVALQFEDLIPLGGGPPKLNTVDGCVFKQGVMTLPSLATNDEDSSKRSMIRYRTDAIYQGAYRPPTAA